MNSLSERQDVQTLLHMLAVFRWKIHDVVDGAAVSFSRHKVNQCTRARSTQRLKSEDGRARVRARRQKWRMKRQRLTWVRREIADVTETEELVFEPGGFDNIYPWGLNRSAGLRNWLKKNCGVVLWLERNRFAIAARQNWQKGC